MKNPFAGDAYNLDKVNTEGQSKDVDPFNFQQFLTWVRTTGLQKTNRFFVDISTPVGFSKEPIKDILSRRKDILLACEEINVPPRTIQTRTLRLNGLNERRANTIDYGNEFTLTFLVDSTNEIQDYFERWMNLEVDQYTREVGEYKDYISTVDLWFLRPYSPSETYDALSRYQNPVNKALNIAKNRAINLAAAEVSKFKTKLKTAFDNAKQKAIGSNIGVYNKIKSILPLELVANTDPTDFAMYQISFKECFPTQITRSVMSQGGTDVLRITVTFAFKDYFTKATGMQKSGPEENFILNFVKRVGIPTSKSALAKAALNLL